MGVRQEIMKLESSIIALYDHGLSVSEIASFYQLTEPRVTNVLVRAARIVPDNCLVCKKDLITHGRCSSCEILLHFGEEKCGTCDLPVEEYLELCHATRSYVSSWEDIAP